MANFPLLGVVPVKLVTAIGALHVTATISLGNQHAARWTFGPAVVLSKVVASHPFQRAHGGVEGRHLVRRATVLTAQGAVHVELPNAPGRVALRAVDGPHAVRLFYPGQHDHVVVPFGLRGRGKQVVLVQLSRVNRLVAQGMEAGERVALGRLLRVRYVHAVKASPTGGFVPSALLRKAHHVAFSEAYRAFSSGIRRRGRSCPGTALGDPRRMNVEVFDDATDSGRVRVLLGDAPRATRSSTRLFLADSFVVLEVSSGHGFGR